MNHEQIAQRVIAETLGELPAELRAAAQSVPVCLEDWPDDALVDDGLAPDILGLFIGAPRHEQEYAAGPPSQIILYLENILAECEDAGTKFDEEVRRTYLHELGHYLGLDEEDLTERDLD